MRYNNLIKFLTFSNLLLCAGWGLVGPVFAIYVTGQIKGADIALIGLASAANMIVRSIFQIPFGRIIDKRKGEVDDFLVLLIGSILVSVVPFWYIWVKTPLDLILSQIVMGFGWAMVTPCWLAIYTRHIDQHREAEEWGFTNALVGLGAALASGLGGFMAERFGFSALFILIGMISVLSNIFLIYVYQDIRAGEKRDTRILRD